MGEILFLAHRVPFPPDRGDKIRSHHLLKALARIAPVHVGTFGETPGDLDQKSGLKEIARTHCLVPRKKPLLWAGVEALLARKPVSLTAFDDAALRRYVQKTLKNHSIDTIFVFSGQMGQYVPDDYRSRIVVDLCDVDSLKFEAYANSGRMPWLNRREARLLKQEESRLAGLADTTLLISDLEVELLRSRLTAGTEANILTLGNGIDASYFDPSAVELQPDLEEGHDPQLVFTGQMNYAPNIQAVQWVIANIMPGLRKRYARARFHIVGRAPVPELRALHGENGVRVWGEVPDVRPFLRSADIVLAPLLIARGVQNKVLEAMAMARPVVLTSEAASGIDAEDGTHFSVTKPDADQMLGRIESLLADPARARKMGNEARRFVLDRMSWEAVLSPLPEIVGYDEGSRDAA